MNIKQYQKQADEYEKYLERIAELAENNIKKSSDNTAEHIKDNIDDCERYSSSEAAKSVELQTETQRVIADLRAKGFDDYKSLRDKEFNDLKIQLASKEISEEDYYSRLAGLRDAYFDEGSNEWAKYTLQIAKYNQRVVEQQQTIIDKMTDSVRAAADETAERYNESFNKLLNKQNSLKNKLQNISRIYDTIEIGNSGKDSYRWIQLSDINSELELLKNYNANFIEAKKKLDGIFDSVGFDKKKTAKLKSDFIEEIAGMNIGDATYFTKYLTNISSDRLTDYISKWAEKNELESLIPSEIYKEESEQLAEQYAADMSESFTKSLEECFGEIPDSFFESGSKSALQFKEGFTEALDGVINDISTEINRRIAKISPNINVSGENGQVSNYSNYYNIYGSGDPYQSAIEIYKQDIKKRMLTGE
mgnify:FL=1